MAPIYASGFAGGPKAGTAPNKNGAVTSAVLVHLRVEPAHFDWRWWERPALALLAWEALARDPVARLCRTQVESIGTTINFRPAATTHHAVSALLIESRPALTAARKKSRRSVDPQRHEGRDEAHNQDARSCCGDQVN
jgi:hypothetical protein